MNTEIWESLVSVKTGPFTLGELGLSFGIILATLFLRKVLARVLFANLKRLAGKTRWEHDDRFLDALESPTSTFILVLGVFLATIVLPFSTEWEDLVRTIFRGLSILIVFWGLFRITDVLVDIMADLSSKTGSDSFRGFGDLVKKSLRVFIIIVGAVMVIDNLGYNIGGILATLGIGGAAFAFAAKDTIANIYGSIALALDRPFQVGDWIQVGDRVDGDVEEIGLRSTKVRTWPKTVISIPNAVLANEMIDNWSRMPKRRVKQVVGVTYETSPETMEKIVQAIRTMLANDPDVNQEFTLVNWTDFGSSSLDILVYYFTTTTKWLEYMDVRQRINVKMANIVREHGSSVAFPTRTLYLEGEIAQQMAGGVRLPDDRGPQQPH
ncbi:mechanosensitive ion channel family protein [Puniceicoccales bacterium CK1056]|uniref:Mechanosensitive ion channel family protein n=1 Tax=Oceanipulchritudo coccoides TaxID=2706888 RepID=A0A6B2M3A7_9BACT|nr:mechanosensitive ion channel family protein [Oceanipulchritudo coccoides]NDV62295.1 mechanosensitive ion channel family protein [Oceanipulchritudo coccoides]